MAMPVGALYPGFVLHRRAYSETSLVLELFTRERGRCAVLAKGVRADGRHRLLTEPLQPLQLAWRGRGELPLLARSEAWEALRLPRATGTAALAGMYLNELLLVLLPRDDPHPVLFDHYLRALQGLTTPQLLAPVLRRFEWALLGELGYAPDLALDAQGAPLQPEACYRYEPHVGALQPVARDGWSGAMLLNLVADRMDASAAQRRFLRELIELQLDGRPVRSFDLLARIEQVLPQRTPAPASEPGSPPEDASAAGE